MSDIETTEPQYDEDGNLIEGDELDAQEPPYEGFQRAVYPELDGQGGTKFVYGGPASGGEEASVEEWAAQNDAPNVALRRDDEIVDAEDDGGSPNPDDPNYNP